MRRARRCDHERSGHKSATPRRSRGSGSEHKCHDPSRADPARRIGAEFDYFKLLSIFAQASATDELALSLPGNVAHPPFSMKEPC